MSDVKKIFTLFIIFIMLFNPVLAADTGQQKEKVIDDTKEKETKIINKDKSITGDIKVTTKDVSKFSVKKKSEYEISISKSGEHTKAKVSIPKSELQKIDIDKDGVYGLLHISDNGEVTHTTATEAELVAGKEMVFSENIVNGYSGHKQYTFSDVESGDILNIDDVSGNYTVTAAVDGVVPTYTAGIPTNGLVGYWPLKQNATDMSGNGYTGTVYDVDFLNGTAYFDGNDYIRFSNILQYEKNITVCGWFSVPYPATKQRFVNKYDTTTRKFSWLLDTGSSSVEYWAAPSTPMVETIVSPSANTWYFNSASFGLSGSAHSVNSVYTNTNVIEDMRTNCTAVLEFGRYTGASQYMKGHLKDISIYTRKLSSSETLQVYAGGSGISFQPEPSYNFTGYDVASGVEKVIDTDSTCTGLEYVDTTGGTHDVTITVYFTEDITVISDSHTATMQTVNISHTSSNTAQDGELIPYDILDGYFGTISMDSTNPNATITRNATNFMVDTGYITANTTYYYNVSIPNYVEEMVWSDWNPDNETCNAKLQISNSTPYTTWNITTYNVTNGSLYKLVYASNGTEVGNATAVNGSASIIIVGLVDGVYWLTETSVLTGFVNVPAVAVVIIGAAGAFVGGSFINKWYRRRRNNN